MNEEYLDHIIDTAAEQMMKREPPASLIGGVMSRVLEGDAQPRRPFVVASGLGWTATAAVTICAALMMVMLNRTTKPAPGVGSPDQAAKIALPSASSVTNGPTEPQQIPVSTGTSERPRQVVRAFRQSPRPTSGINESVRPEPPIVFESIVPDPIDVRRLEVSVTAMDQIEINPLVVEPLTASND